MLKWSSANDTLLLSLTAQWIDSQFKRTFVVLNTRCLTETHIGEYIAVQIITMLKKQYIAIE